MAAPTLIGSQQTVQPGDIQNGPPSFVETDTGKFLNFYTPSVSHVGSGSIVFKPSANETASLAGTFGSVIYVATESYPYYYGMAGATKLKRGVNKGRVWISYARATLPSPSLLQCVVRYTDNPDAATPTWSSEIVLPNLWVSDGVAGWQLASLPAAPIVELPNGHLILPVYGGNGSEGGDTWNKLYKSTDGGATWFYFSTISARISGMAEAEPNIALVRLANGTARLVCVYNSVSRFAAYSTSTIKLVYSDGPDLGATWSSPVDCGLGANWGGNPAIEQMWDGSVVIFIRNVGPSAYQSFYSRSTSYGDAGTFTTPVSVYPTGSMRYGTWQRLLSGHTGLIFSTETTTENAGVYLRIYQENDPAALITTAVGKSLGQPYGILPGFSAVGKSCSMPYTMIAATGKSLVQPYLVEAVHATKSLEMTYNLRNVTGRSMDCSYTIGRVVGESLEFRYTIPVTTISYETNRRVGPIQQAYSTLRRVDVGLSFASGKSLPTPYAISPPVSKPLPMGYKIEVITSKSLQMAWNDNVIVGKSLEMFYKFTVGRSLDQEYAIIGRVGASLVMPYASTGPIGKQLRMDYTLGVTRKTTHSEFVRGRTSVAQTGRET